MDKQKMDDWAAGCVAVLSAMIVGMACGSWLTFDVMRANWREEAVKHGAAEYDSTTGNWRWKPLPEAPEAQP